MSRGFVKEGDQEETPLVIPRAYLPAGVINYVTPNGLVELKNEKNLLIKERKIVKQQSTENNRVQINYINSKLNLLEERISSARLADVSNQSQDEVHFGATVTLFKMKENSKCKYQIVGVDEATISQNKISFLSPIARALLSKKAGDEITLQLPKGKRIMRIEAIEY